LDELPINDTEGRTQSFMTSDDFVKTLRQRRHVQHSRETQEIGEGEEGRIKKDLVEKPDLRLCRCCRYVFWPRRLFGKGDWDIPLCLMSRLDIPHHFGHGWAIEQDTR
jgi:hypothetical protein